MYFSKVATTEQEFDAIATLNYETFVEEIPQQYCKVWKGRGSKRSSNKAQHK